MVATSVRNEAWILLASLVFDHRGPWRERVVGLTGMPMSRFRALRRLETRPRTGRELAAAIDVDAPAASVIVTDLVARGLATSSPDPDDGRRKVFSLTDAGRELLDRVRREVPVPDALDALTDDEVATLRALVEKMGAR